MIRMSARPPAKFSEKGDWNLWVTRFERYVQEAKVPDKEMVKELLPLLDDEPLRLVVQNDLSESADYKAVRDCLQSRYGHEGTEMEWQAKFQTRVQQRGESLVEYAGELRVLAGRAFPTWSNEQREMLTRNQFIQGISSPSVQVQLMKDMPKTVSEAVATARRLEAVEAAHKRLQTGRNADGPLAAAVTHVPAGWEDTLHRLTIQVERLAEEVTTLKKEPVEEPRRFEQPSKVAHRNRDIVCWHCNEKGHVKRNCPEIGKRPLNWSGSVGKVYRRPRM